VEAIRRSVQLVGPIQEIVKDQDGRTLSGRHRELADQGFPTRTIPVKDGFHRELIILLSNIQRQPEDAELKFRLNRVAMEYWIKTKIWDEKEQKEIQIPEEKVCADLCKLFDPEGGPRIFRARRIEELLEPRWKAKTIPKKVAFSATSLNIPKRIEAIKKTALSLQNQPSDGKIQYPDPECKCHECLGHTRCYGCEPTKLKSHP